MVTRLSNPLLRFTTKSADLSSTIFVSVASVISVVSI
jgi:hypothetical protein